LAAPPTVQIKNVDGSQTKLVLSPRTERHLAEQAGAASSWPFYLSNRQHDFNIFRKPLIR